MKIGFVGLGRMGGNMVLNLIEKGHSLVVYDKSLQAMEDIQRRNVYTKKHQIGTTNIVRDKARKALAPGKKISKTGKIYYEYRKNRVDLVGTKV